MSLLIERDGDDVVIRDAESHDILLTYKVIGDGITQSGIAYEMVADIKVGDEALGTCRVCNVVLYDNVDDDVLCPSCRGREPKW